METIVHKASETWFTNSNSYWFFPWMVRKQTHKNCWCFFDVLQRAFKVQQNVVVAPVFTDIQKCQNRLWLLQQTSWHDALSLTIAHVYWMYGKMTCTTLNPYGTKKPKLLVNFRRTCWRSLLRLSNVSSMNQPAITSLYEHYGLSTRTANSGKMRTLNDGLFGNWLHCYHDENLSTSRTSW